MHESDKSLLVPVPEMDLHEFRNFADLFSDHIGIFLPITKRNFMSTRLAKRLRVLGLQGFDEYWKLLNKDGLDDELQLAVDLITTNETFFFREPNHFKYLSEFILPELHEKNKPVKIWSAASSTGQEAYSIAMIMAEYFGLEKDWLVYGTDISNRVLKKARNGVYPMGEVKNIDAVHLKRYCLRGNEEYEGYFLIDGELRRHVDFFHANLMAEMDESLAGFDVVFLRNVMIYFESKRVSELLEKLRCRINKGGYLVVGHTESMAVKNSGFKQIKPSIYQRI